MREKDRSRSINHNEIVRIKWNYYILAIIYRMKQQKLIDNW